MKWGGAGIIRLIESSVTGANRGCESGTSSSLPENGTIGTAYISTGGGSPGSNVRGQYGYRDALLNNNRREEEEEEEEEELNPTNIDRIGRTGWQGSSQVKNEEVVVDSEGSLRWRRRKRKQRHRKWCYAIQFKILVILCPLDGRHV